MSFASSLGQALTMARTGDLAGQNEAEATNYARALQAQVLANQEEQKQWQREHGDTGDLLKLLGIQGVLADKGITGAPGTVGGLRSQLGDQAPNPAAPPSSTSLGAPDFAAIASAGAAPADTPPPPMQQQGAAPQSQTPPTPRGGLTVNPNAGNAGANRRNKLEVAQRVQTVEQYTPEGKAYKFTYDTHTGRGLAPQAVIGLKSAAGKPIAAGDTITVADLPPGTKPTAQNVPGAVAPDERLIWQEASKELKPLQDDAIKFVNAASALQSAENKNPVAYASALSKFVQATEQSSNLRQGLLFYFRDNLRPDVNGKLQLFVQRNVDGSYPPEALAQMKQHVADMEKGIYDMYDTRWQAFASQSPLVQRAFPNAQTIFHRTASTPPAAPAPVDKEARNRARAQLGLSPLP